MTARYKANKVKLYSGERITIYASPKVAEALDEVSGDLNLYKGVRLAQVLEAFYVQGKKDGARMAFEEIEKGFTDARKAIPHRTPGRPKAP